MSEYFIAINDKGIKRYRLDLINDEVYHGLDENNLCHEFDKSDNIYFLKDVEELCLDH
jgi:hypothetical protein